MPPGADGPGGNLHANPAAPGELKFLCGKAGDYRGYESCSSRILLRKLPPTQGKSMAGDRVNHRDIIEESGDRAIGRSREVIASDWHQTAGRLHWRVLGLRVYPVALLEG